MMQCLLLGLLNLTTDLLHSYLTFLIHFQQGDGINNPSPSQRWNVIESVKGAYGHDDCVNDIAEIKFERPIAIKVSFTVLHVLNTV